MTRNNFDIHTKICKLSTSLSQSFTSYSSYDHYTGDIIENTISFSDTCYQPKVYVFVGATDFADSSQYISDISIDGTSYKKLFFFFVEYTTTCMGNGTKN